MLANAGIQVEFFEFQEPGFRFHGNHELSRPATFETRIRDGEL